MRLFGKIKKVAQFTVGDLTPKNVEIREGDKVDITLEETGEKKTGYVIKLATKELLLQLIDEEMFNIGVPYGNIEILKVLKNDDSEVE